MPIFDAAAPADNTKAGLGAKVIRDELKTIFNTLLETYVLEVIDAKWECLKGWPRVYVAASGAPPSVPANADDGRLWYVSDLGEMRVHDGTNWVRISACCDMRIPLFFGSGIRHTNADYAILPAGLLYLSSSSSWVGRSWAAGEGVSFNKANAPVGSTIKLAVVGGTEVTPQAKVQLWDVAADAAVTGSEVNIAGGVAVSEVLSGDLTSAITAGDRKFRLYGKAGTAAWYDIVAVELRIQKA